MTAGAVLRGKARLGRPALMSEVIRLLKAIGGLTKERSFAERSLWRGEGTGNFDPSVVGSNPTVVSE